MFKHLGNLFNIILASNCFLPHKAERKNIAGSHWCNPKIFNMINEIIITYFTLMILSIMIIN